ncbi:unnamed protein product [Paramecium sonneborni]|uniref:Transmembrane protein n=1 Tax=Paramecium sonneborni TaxID=65129 RepID=A0A8S1KQL1_9CILI|nr:unnamed protein product [Paramecium sonneborni]
MKSSNQLQILRTLIPKQQLTEEDDDLPNPMLDSIISQKSQQSYLIPAKNMKLILNSNRSDKTKSPFRKQNQAWKIGSESKKSSYQNQYKQIDILFPLLKLVQLNQKQNKTECFNGEEVTIDQKIYFIKANEILNIFQKSADGYTLSLEEADEVQEKEMKKSVSISEKMIKSMKAIKTFKKAKNKIKSFILVSDVSKQTDELIKYKQQVDKMNQFFNDDKIIYKSDHQLGEQIIKTKQLSPQKDQISETQNCFKEKEEIIIENKNKKGSKRYYQLIDNSKRILKQIAFIIGIFLLIFVMAYIKTLNSVTIHIEDL